MERYDRQNLTYGENATKNIISSNVLLLADPSFPCLVTEIAKNLLLSGVKSLQLTCRQSELTYDISNLNPMCKIKTSVNYEDVIINESPLVILTQGNKKFACDLNIVCRNNNCKMIWAYSSGVAGFVFVDVMESHIVKDLDGEVVDPLQIENMDTKGLTEVIGDLNNIKDNDTIKFTSLVGNKIDFLRNKDFKIFIKDKKSVFIKNLDGSNIDELLLKEMDLLNGTIVIEKGEYDFSHQSLNDQMNRLMAAGGGPFLKNSFNEDFDTSVLRLLIKGVQYLNIWSDKKDAQVEKYNKDLGKVVRSIGIEIPCISSIIGSYASNEAIKIITKKFTPLDQWFLFSDHNLVPEKRPELHDKQALTFSYLMGKKFENFISNSSLLMVGCGAIGCEMLKNLAQLGFCTGSGKLTITDPDHIEVSNLSRQFLFRNEHVKQSKSKVAAESIKKFNEKINVVALDQKMCPDNQDLADKIFLSEDIIGVINALDNAEARRYMDDQCFNYCKALFESGTQGMKGNTQPVIPFLTETYSNTTDPNDVKDYPVCTIKNFPNQIHHTIHWAMDLFEFFNRAPDNTNKYIENKNFLDDLPGYEKGTAVKDINLFLIKMYPPTWQKCAIWAGKMFLENFRDQILQILNNFPEDSLNNDGTMFWSKGKRCPTVLDLDLTNEIVLDFIESTTRLLMFSYNIDQNLLKRDDLLSVEYDYYDYEIKDIKIAKDDNELKSINKEGSELNKLSLSDLEEHDSIIDSVKESSLKFVPHEFEKDDDSNYHIKFIQSASNLRAINYGIDPVSFNESKSIAGRIIPAVVTTTSMVSALITLELLKYCYQLSEENDAQLDNYRSTFVNLATNIFISSEPISAPKLKIGDNEFNSWKKFVETNDMKLKDFIKKYSEEFSEDITMILYGTGIIFAEFMKSEEELEENISVLLKNKSEVNVWNGNPINLVLACDNEDIELPSIQLKF